MKEDISLETARLGPRVLVCETAGPGTELSIGILSGGDLGPLVVVGAGGVLVEHLADRAVALPPVDAAGAGRMLSRLRVARLLNSSSGVSRNVIGNGVRRHACAIRRNAATASTSPPFMS